MPEETRNKIHAFNNKLLQASVIESLKCYVKWQRALRSSQSAIHSTGVSPISINLDLTTACNFACPHCVDLKVLNTGDTLSFEDIKQTLNILCQQGLKSVILIGGGEPTLHRHFGNIVRYIKSLNLQVGIVTNGTRMDRILEVAHSFTEKDWIRLSLDAGTEKSFQAIHHPRIKTSLQDICGKVRQLADLNTNVSIGFSYVATWRGCKVGDVELRDNIDEITDAVQLAKDSGFTYFSIKPCLVKLEDSRQESLLYGARKEQTRALAGRIKQKIAEAREIAGDKIKIVESANLLAMLNGELDALKNQTATCHAQFFRQVVTPIGIFNCPAYRGESKALLADKNGYNTREEYNRTVIATERKIAEFNAHQECKDIVCLYNSTNKWIEELIESNIGLDTLESTTDADFFL